MSEYCAMPKNLREHAAALRNAFMEGRKSVCGINRSYSEQAWKASEAFASLPPAAVSCEDGRHIVQSNDQCLRCGLYRDDFPSPTPSEIGWRQRQGGSE